MQNFEFLYACACDFVIVFTQEIWELEKGPGTIEKHRFRILFGARQGGEPREPDLARLGCSREAVGSRGTRAKCLVLNGLTTEGGYVNPL